MPVMPPASIRFARSEKQVHGLDDLTARLAPMRGMTLPFVNSGKPSGRPAEVVLARWNATQAYGRRDGAWRIIHTHWSLQQPRLAARAGAG